MIAWNLGGDYWDLPNKVLLKFLQASIEDGMGYSGRGGVIFGSERKRMKSFSFSKSILHENYKALKKLKNKTSAPNRMIN